MIIKYMSSPWDPIKKVQVERETKSSVWINGQSYRKESSMDVYHDTWEEARQRMIRMAEAKLQSAEYMMRSAQREMDKAMAISEHEPEVAQ